MLEKRYALTLIYHVTSFDDVTVYMIIITSCMENSS